MKFLSALFVCCVTSSLLGNALVQYEILSIDNNMFSLTNQAIFQASKETSAILSTWKVGETLTMRAVPELSIFQETPHLLFENSEQSTLVLAQLIQSPVTISAGTYSIMSVNLDQRMINLSDTSAWLFESSEVGEVVDWEVGDLIMFGQSLLSSDYDTILFNTTQQSVVAAEQI